MDAHPCGPAFGFDMEEWGFEGRAHDHARMAVLSGIAAAIALAISPVLPNEPASEPAAPAPSAPSAAEALSDAEAEKLEAFEGKLDAVFATGDFVGLAVAVVRGGETTLLKTYGVTEAGGAEAIAPHTVFRIASLSKGVASSLAGIAIAEGRLATDENAARFAPGFKLRGGAEKFLTIGHVMSHRTGLPSHAYDNLLEGGAAPDDIIKRYPELQLVCSVGACYAYQNIAFDIVGRALSSVYGMSFADLAREKLFVPLGMTTATVGEDAILSSASYARPHRRIRYKSGKLGPWRAAPVKAPYYRIPAAGGVNASILDMAEWLKAQMGARPDVLSPEVLAAIHEPRVETPAETARIRPVSTRYWDSSYGYGWRIYDYEGRRLVTHSGTVDGYTAQIAFLPDERVGLVILSNTRPRRVWRILPTFLDIELGLTREDWLALGPKTVKAGSP